jgi:hypothetical protein
MRAQAALFARACVDLGLIRPERGASARFNLPDVSGGQAVCAAFEAFRSRCPNPTLTIEQAFLVVTALTRDGELALEICPQCSAPFLSDPLSFNRHRKHRCCATV